MVDPEDILIPVRQVAYRRIGDQVVLVSPRDNALMTLNQTGSTAWEALDGKRNVHQVAAEVHRRFEVTEAEALRDVTAFLSQMLERGLVAREPD